jgi:hypothetical protein
LAQGTTRGVPIDTDPLLTADSDLLVPSQKAVKAYADTKGDMKLAFVQTNLGAKTFLDTTFLLRNVANTFNGSFTNTNTADRIYTLPDTAGTIALTSNLTGYVPYTGATANVDLGANNLFANRIGIGTITPASSLDVFGTGTDAYVNSAAGFNVNLVAPPTTTATLTLIAGTALNIGQYQYRFTYYTAIGETSPNVWVAGSYITTTAGNQAVALTNIPISSDPRVIGRKIYRNRVNEGSSYASLIATIADNTTTTYTDTTPDASIPAMTSIFAKANTTSNYIMVSGTRAMILDNYLTAVGFNAGVSVTNGATNSLFGSQTGRSITSGSSNTLFGGNAGGLITTGNENCGVGKDFLRQLITGNYNVGVGPNVLQNITNGSFNIAFGYYAGGTLTGGASYNIFVGGYGNITSGSYNVSLGHSVTFPTPTASYQLNIANFIQGVYAGSTRGLVVNGTTANAMWHVIGSSATTGNAFLVQNSTPSDLFTVANNGLVTVGVSHLRVTPGFIYSQSFRSSVASDTYIALNGTTSMDFNIHSVVTIGFTWSKQGSGTYYTLNGIGEGNYMTSFAPTSGSTAFSYLKFTGTINQTGGANGITRGIYINPTLTAAADYRAIEAITGNNSAHTLLKLSNNTRDVLCVKGDNKIGLFNATPTIQGTTAMAAATYTNNGSIDLDTFDGYTIGQVVVQLRNMGILS